MPMKILENKENFNIDKIMELLNTELNDDFLVKKDEKTGNVNVFNGGKGVVSCHKDPLSTIHIYADNDNLLDNIAERFDIDAEETQT